MNSRFITPKENTSHQNISNDTVESAQGLNLYDLFQILSRHWRVLFFPPLLITVGLFLILQFVAPRYTAQARILIQGETTNPTDMAPVSAGLPVNDDSIASSERFILTSYDFLNEVIDDLSLDIMPEFNPSLREPSSDSELTVPALSPEQIRSQVVSALVKKIDVFNELQSRVLTIEVTTSTPEQSAAIANLIVEKYIEQQVQKKLTQASRVDNWLASRVDKLRRDVKQAEADVEAFKQQSELLQSGGSTIISQQISELNTLLLRARNDRIAAVAQVKSTTDVLESAVIRSLKNSESDLRREAARLARKYGPRHPSILLNEADLSRVRKEIRNETRRISASLENEVNVAQEREQKLESELSTLKALLSEANLKEVKLREMEREASASRELLVAFLPRQKEVQSQNDESIQQADARIISYAGVPHTKSFPKILPITALGFVASTFLALILVFLLEQFSVGYKSAEEVSNSTGLPVLGLIPLAPKVKNINDLMGIANNTQIGESFMNLLDRLGLSKSSGNKVKVGRTILVTSTYPNDGKSSVVCCLAKSLQNSGKKVLLIDGDLRKPSLHEIFSVNQMNGVQAIMWNKISLSDLAKPTAHSLIDVIPAGNSGLKDHPHDIFTSVAFSKLLVTARRHYDVIIVDSPPLKAVNDASIILKHVQDTLFVMPWRRVSQKAINSGLNKLDREKVSGIVLTMVNIGEHERYSYGEVGRYNKLIKEYYSPPNA